METLTQTDVCIIGGGPAGATLAALLAGRGAGVVLLERDTFPRDKVCGEFLSYDALPLLERMNLIADLDAAGAPFIRACRIVGAKRIDQFELPHPARGVSRELFDELLFRHAGRCGAQLMSGTTAVEISGNDVILADGSRIHAKVIAGSWGRWGRFDTQLKRRFVTDRRHRNFGFKRHYRGTVPPDDSIELHSFRHGYLGVNAIEGGLTNICGLVHASRLSGLRGRWDAFASTIRAERPQLDALYRRYEPAQPGFLTSEPVIFRARSPVENGIVMIGDASGVIDPLTGNGMAMALQSALIAAPPVLRMLAGHWREGEREYERSHARMFGRRIGWSRRVAALLSRPRLLEALLAVPGSGRLGPLALRNTRASRDEIERLADAWFSLQ